MKKDLRRPSDAGCLFTTCDSLLEGKLAIKIINHYGDEVLKVYEVKQG